MSDWRTQAGLVFACEHHYGYLWVPDRQSLGALLTDVPGARYPRSASWQITAAGRRVYGRHSGLKTVLELRDADLIRFAPRTVAEAGRMIACLKAEPLAQIR
jgi:hypothetical protein